MVIKWFRGHDTARVMVSRDSVMWGVRRRGGFSEFDDPLAHRGRVKHAFVFGSETRAVCGYRPVRWGRSGVPLAAPTEHNPACQGCLAGVTGAIALGPTRPLTIWPEVALELRAPIPGPVVVAASNQKSTARRRRQLSGAAGTTRSRSSRRAAGKVATPGS